MMIQHRVHHQLPTIEVDNLKEWLTKPIALLLLAREKFCLAAILEDLLHMPPGTAVVLGGLATMAEPTVTEDEDEDESTVTEDEDEPTVTEDEVPTNED
eukprot:13105547-Alexandrium_andersonii.AAC.1